MNDLIWMNGEIMPMAEARIGVEDRGFQFADGVYEVVRIYNGRPFTLAQHLARLENSCEGIALSLPMGADRLAVEIEGLIAQTGVVEGMVYLQITRGEAPRNHGFPGCRPTMLFYVRELPPMTPPGQTPAVRLLSVADERWQRCWIKSIALLANVLAKNQALAAGADEAVFIEGDRVTECASSNLFVVAAGKLITAPVGPKVLPGITRAVLLELAKELGIGAEERAVSETEALSADELFVTSTTREVGWVSHWNGRAVASERRGPVTLRLHEAFQGRVLRETRR